MRAAEWACWRKAVPHRAAAARVGPRPQRDGAARWVVRSARYRRRWCPLSQPRAPRFTRGTDTYCRVTDAVAEAVWLLKAADAVTV